MAEQRRVRVAVVGGGPAGLMAAESARAHGAAVDLYESKGSVGRKFLIAGKGGLNLTHGEPFERFVSRYGRRADAVGAWLRGFDPDALRAWARGLGVATFVGTSGRVFPHDLKAAPLLRRWVHRLRESGVHLHVRHRWIGWTADGALYFDAPAGELAVHADAVVLALGGASWPQLGSDGAWVPWLQARGVAVAMLQPSNCGFDVSWSAHFAQRYAGHPLKPVVAKLAGGASAPGVQGECVITADGIEGQLIYTLSPALRETIARDGSAELLLDLAPGRTVDRLQRELVRPRSNRSRSEHWRRSVGLSGAKAGLVLESVPRDALDDPVRVAAAIKALPLRLLRARPLAEAISTAGGVRLEALTDGLMLRAMPGVFCAGEMLDWDAPTGGYLLNACFASGLLAGSRAATYVPVSTTASA